MADKKVDEVKLPYINNQIHWISKTSTPVGNAWTKQMVEDRLTELYDLGYVLSEAAYIGDNPEAYGILYVLVLSK